MSSPVLIREVALWWNGASKRRRPKSSHQAKRRLTMECLDRREMLSANVGVALGCNGPTAHSPERTNPNGPTTAAA